VQPLALVGPSYTARSLNFDASRCVNLYPEASGSGLSKSIAMLVGCPGLTRFATLTGSGVRGAIRFSSNVSIVVTGGDVYRVNTLGAGTLIGVVTAATTPVSMASNGSVIMLVTGAEGYVIDPTAATVTKIIDPDFFGGDRVDYIDGYFVFNRPGTQQFQITSLLGTAVDPLDFASAEGAPDLLISLLVDHLEIWLFGETTTEVFFNSGNPDFPFERIQGAFIQQGCAAKFSPARFSSAVAWLSQNDQGQGMVVKSNGYQPERISTHAVEYAIAQYTRIDDAIGMSYQREGHEFYVLTFPTANATWVYDASTQLWHERAWRDPADGSLNRHRAQCVISFANKIIVGDWSNPYLYSWDLNAYTDDGGILPAIRQVPHIASDDNSLTVYWKLWVDIEAGVGLNGTGQGSDPQVMLSWSDDGGHTFGTELTVAAGKIGEYKRRANFRRLGASRDRVFRVSMTDPVKRIFIAAGIEASPGSA
jgi:hypothetical protein